MLGTRAWRSAARTGTVTSAMHDVMRSGIRRRRLLAALPLLTLAAAPRSRAAAMKRIGLLIQGEHTGQAPLFETRFVDSLRARNWTAGRDYELLHAYTDWRSARADVVVRALLRQRVDVIVTFGDDETVTAAARATQSVPIVFNLAFAPGTYQIRVTPQGTKTVIYDSGGTVLTPNIALSFVTYTKGSSILVNAAVLQSEGPGGTLVEIAALDRSGGADTDAVLSDLVADLQEEPR